MKLFIIVLIISTALFACGKKSTEYYQQNPEEMKAKLNECKGMSSAEVFADRECKAAIDAHSKRFFGDHIEKPGSGKGKPLPKF